jgi:nitrite reductase/ring-hydroxylating ferredoxin subunit
VTTPSRPVDRRSVLAFGSACLAAAATGCAADNPAPTGVPATSAGSPAAVPTETVPTEIAAAEPTTAAAPRILAGTKTIPVGGGRLVGTILVVQPLDGLFKAYDARCPHLAALVSPPRDGIITCTVHGSKFVDIDGSRLEGPATRGLKEIPVIVEGGNVVTA